MMKQILLFILLTCLLSCDLLEEQPRTGGMYDVVDDPNLVEYLDGSWEVRSSAILEMFPDEVFKWLIVFDKEKSTIRHDYVFSEGNDGIGTKILKSLIEDEGSMDFKIINNEIHIFTDLSNIDMYSDTEYSDYKEYFHKYTIIDRSSENEMKLIGHYLDTSDTYECVFRKI